MPGTNLLTAKDISYRLKRSRARFAVVSEDHVEKVESVRAECPSLEHLIVVGTQRGGWHSFEELCASGEGTLERSVFPTTRREDPMLVYFTSGTTAYPKMVPRDHSYAFAHAITGKYWLDLKPGGKYVAKDMYEVGGVPVVMKELRKDGLIHEDCMTATGRTIGEELDIVEREADGRVIYPIEAPLTKTGGVVGLKGNLAPEGSVSKLTGIKNRSITGPARVFESEEDCLDAILANKIKAGDVIVVRYEGPKGGPGMREMLAPTSAIIGAGLGDSARSFALGGFEVLRTFLKEDADKVHRCVRAFQRPVDRGAVANIGLDDIDPARCSGETHIPGCIGATDGNADAVSRFDEGAGGIAADEAGSAEEDNKAFGHGSSGLLIYSYISWVRARLIKARWACPCGVWLLKSMSSAFESKKARPAASPMVCNRWRLVFLALSILWRDSKSFSTPAFGKSAAIAANSSSPSKLLSEFKSSPASTRR